MLRPPGSTPFPYTTLFRSEQAPGSRDLKGPAPAVQPPAQKRKHGRIDEDEGFRRLFERKAARQLIRSEEHTSELQSRQYIVCRLLLENKTQRGAHSSLNCQ